MKLEELHDCKKCHGKIVFIGIDHVGNAYCGYCGQKVDYRKWLAEELKKLERSRARL